jgi:cytoskeletal protein CcmA (bactofilin family)
MAQARTSRGGGGGEAVVGSGTRIRGRVSGDGDLLIAGTVDGDIALRGSLTIADGASCTSNVEATTVTVSGTLEGDVNASGQVTIGAGARVVGNVRGAGVAIEEGAAFAGRLDCEFDLPDGLSGASHAPARRR